MSWSDRLLWAALGALLGIGGTWLLLAPEPKAPPAPEDADAPEELTPLPGNGQVFSQHPDSAEIEPATATSRDGRVVGGETPRTPAVGDVQKLRMSLTSHAADTASVGTAFEVVHKLRNNGTRALEQIELATQAGEGIKLARGSKARWSIARLVPGATFEVQVGYIPEREGEFRIATSAREKRGWAAAGSYMGVHASEMPAERTEVVSLDLDMSVEYLDVVRAGQPFKLKVHLENTGGMALSGVSLGWRAMHGVSRVGETTERSVLGRIAPGQTVTRELEFRAGASFRGDTHVSISAREERGWAAVSARVDLNEGVGKDE